MQKTIILTIVVSSLLVMAIAGVISVQVVNAQTPKPTANPNSNAPPCLSGNTGSNTPPCWSNIPNAANCQSQDCCTSSQECSVVMRGPCR